MMRMLWAHRKFAKHVLAWVDAGSLARDLERRFPLVSFESLVAAPEQEISLRLRFLRSCLRTRHVDRGSAISVSEWKLVWKGNSLRAIELQLCHL